MSEAELNKTNIGIALLKALMAFEVVLAHFCKWPDSMPIYMQPFRTLVSLAVPVFFVVSFYYSEKIIISRNRMTKFDRLKKLFLPQLIWAIIYFDIFLILDRFCGTGNNATTMDLLYQVFTGHSSKLNSAMWFQFDLIIITALFCLIYSKDKKTGLVLTLIITALSIYLQISGINYSFFNGMIFELKYPLGRLAEMIPYATLGFLLKYFDILDTLKKHRYISIIVATILFIAGFIIKWPTFSDFGYGGFTKLYLCIFPVIIAYLFPFEYLTKGIKEILLKLCENTLGIYCMHILVAKLIKVFLPVIYSETFIGCIIIYVVSYLISCIIKALFTRSAHNFI
ncbi:MAG: acyltransferase [Erysipelotrichaceae bacterium]|nr:acyltransferase [Erysipelotrichaceae bacterium]